MSTPRKPWFESPDLPQRVYTRIKARRQRRRAWGAGLTCVLLALVLSLRGKASGAREELASAQQKPAPVGLSALGVAPAPEPNASPATLIDAQEAGGRRRIDALLSAPSETISGRVRKTRGCALNERWFNEVVSRFNRSLEGRYPFSPDGHDAALADVEAFFRQGSGTVWSFYDSVLLADIGPSGGILKPTPEALTFLKRAHELSESLFARGAQEPSMRFFIHIRPSPKLSFIRFRVDGQTVEYRQGPEEEWIGFSWPNPGAEPSASLLVRNSRGQSELIEQEGEWGLFRLMEQGTVEPGAQAFSVTWQIPSMGSEVVIDFRASRSASPFFGVTVGRNGTLLQPFRMPGVVPPPALVTGASKCSEE